MQEKRTQKKMRTSIWNENIYQTLEKLENNVLCCKHWHTAMKCNICWRSEETQHILGNLLNFLSVTKPFFTIIIQRKTFNNDSRCLLQTKTSRKLIKVKLFDIFSRKHFLSHLHVPKINSDWWTKFFIFSHCYTHLKNGRW